MNKSRKYFQSFLYKRYVEITVLEVPRIDCTIKCLSIGALKDLLPYW